jgi:hypothetical protein
MIILIAFILIAVFIAMISKVWKVFLIVTFCVAVIIIFSRSPPV